MIIVETSIFTRQVTELLPDDEYRKLQSILVGRPDAGKIIPGSGGLVRYAGVLVKKVSEAAHGLSTIGLSRMSKS